MLCDTHIIRVGNIDTIYGSTFSIEINDYLINTIIDKYILENIIFTLHSHNAFSLELILTKSYLLMYAQLDSAFCD